MMADRKAILAHTIASAMSVSLTTRSLLLTRKRPTLGTTRLSTMRCPGLVSGMLSAARHGFGGTIDTAVSAAPPPIHSPCETCGRGSSLCLAVACAMMCLPIATPSPTGTALPICLY